MLIEILKSKIHRATVTGAVLDYEGSISIDRQLCRDADLMEFEKVEIWNVTNGERLSTYVIYGGPGEICLNGAAARKVQPGDQVIISAFASLPQEEARSFRPIVLLVNKDNRLVERIHKDRQENWK